MERPIIVEETFSVNAQTLWNAITELDEMIQWYFDNIPMFKAVVGFETAFNIKSSERSFSHLWKVTEVIPLQKITYRWKYKEYAGESFSTFELFEEEHQTTLRVVCIGLETFPKNVPEFSNESCLAGWNYFIKNRLKTYIFNK